MSEAYTKTELIKELAAAARISKRRAELLLENLTQIAYREARRGFAVPGICRLDVVHRKARLVRNPQTNEILQIAEHDALRVRPVKRAKDAIAPAPRAMIQVITEAEVAAQAPVAPPPAAPIPTASPVTATAPASPTPAPAPAAPAPAAKPPAPVIAAAPPPAAPAPAPKPYTTVPPPASKAPVPPPVAPKPPAPAAPPPAAAPEATPAAGASEEGQFISFRCKNCGQEIEAPLEMVGAPNECPTCGENLIVPYTSEPGTIWYQERTTSPQKMPPTPSAIAAMKGRTIRIELPDDL